MFTTSIDGGLSPQEISKKGPTTIASDALTQTFGKKFDAKAAHTELKKQAASVLKNIALHTQQVTKATVGTTLVGDHRNTVEGVRVVLVNAEGMGYSEYNKSLTGPSLEIKTRATSIGARDAQKKLVEEAKKGLEGQMQPLKTALERHDGVIKAQEGVVQGLDGAKQASSEEMNGKRNDLVSYAKAKIVCDAVGITLDVPESGAFAKQFTKLSSRLNKVVVISEEELSTQNLNVKQAELKRSIAEQAYETVSQLTGTEDGVVTFDVVDEKVGEYNAEIREQFLLSAEQFALCVGDAEVGLEGVFTDENEHIKRFKAGIEDSGREDGVLLLQEYRQKLKQGLDAALQVRDTLRVELDVCQATANEKIAAAQTAIYTENVQTMVLKKTPKKAKGDALKKMDADVKAYKKTEKTATNAKNEKFKEFNIKQEKLKAENKKFESETNKIIENRQSTQQQALDKANKKLTGLKSTADREVAKLVKKHEALSAKLERGLNKYEAKKMDVALQEDLAAIEPTQVDEGGFESAHSEVQGYQGKIEDLQGNITRYQQQIAELDAQLTAEYADLQDRVGELNRGVLDKKQEVEGFAAQIKQINTEFDQAKTRPTTFQAVPDVDVSGTSTPTTGGSDVEDGGAIQPGVIVLEGGDNLDAAVAGTDTDDGAAHGTDDGGGLAPGTVADGGPAVAVTPPDKPPRQKKISVVNQYELNDGSVPIENGYFKHNGKNYEATVDDDGTVTFSKPEIVPADSGGIKDLPGDFFESYSEKKVTSPGGDDGRGNRVESAAASTDVLDAVGGGVQDDGSVPPLEELAVFPPSALVAGPEDVRNVLPPVGSKLMTQVCGLLENSLYLKPTLASLGFSTPLTPDNLTQCVLNPDLRTVLSTISIESDIVDQLALPAEIVGRLEISDGRYNALEMLMSILGIEYTGPPLSIDDGRGNRVKSAAASTDVLDAVGGGAQDVGLVPTPEYLLTTSFSSRPVQSGNDGVPGGFVSGVRNEKELAAKIKTENHGSVGSPPKVPPPQPPTKSIEPELDFLRTPPPPRPSTKLTFDTQVESGIVRKFNLEMHVFEEFTDLENWSELNGQYYAKLSDDLVMRFDPDNGLDIVEMFDGGEGLPEIKLYTPESIIYISAFLGLLNQFNTKVESGIVRKFNVERDDFEGINGLENWIENNGQYYAKLSDDLVMRFDPDNGLDIVEMFHGGEGLPEIELFSDETVGYIDAALRMKGFVAEKLQAYLPGNTSFKFNLGSGPFQMSVDSESRQLRFADGDSSNIVEDEPCPSRFYLESDALGNQSSEPTPSTPDQEIPVETKKHGYAKSKGEKIIGTIYAVTGCLKHSNKMYYLEPSSVEVAQDGGLPIFNLEDLGIVGIS